jgi:bifunctional polynucleotide phosphatase/kinase
VLLDLDSTLVETKSGRRFARDAGDWRWKYELVAEALRAIIREGYLVIIVTNQLGAAYGCPREALLRERIDQVLTAAGVLESAFVLAATADDEYRKPRVGMWSFLVSRVLGGIQPQMRGSVFVGDAAGRPGDHADTDRKFAINVGLCFETPEEFFMCEEPKWYELSGWEPTLTVLGSSRDELEALTAGVDGPDLVMLVGRPASGKSTLCESIFEPAGYVRVCQDVEGTLPRCLVKAKALLQQGLSIVVDATNGSREARARWLGLCREFGVESVRAVVLDVPLGQARHMNRYREALGGKAHVPAVAYRTHESRYEAPTVEEGFTEVVSVRPELSFAGERERELFLRRYE